VIPLALAIAILVLEKSGQSLNLMSVGGLAVAVGLIIDDAIVVVEAIARAVAEQPRSERTTVISTAVSRLAGPMAASTLTTVVVFIPLGLLSGVTGFFFRALAFTLAVSLIVSLLLAVGVAPIIASRLFRDDRPYRERTDGLQRFYEPVLGWALGHRSAVYAGAGVVLVATVVLLAQLPSDFLPKLDEGEFEIKYLLPAGATLEDSDAAASRMERVVMADPDVESVGRLTGIDTNGFTPTQANSGTLRVALHAGPRAGYDALADRLRETLSTAVPAADLDFHQLLEDQIDDLSGAPQPVEVTLSGSDQARLVDLADTTTDAISRVRGIVDAYDGVTYDDPSIAIAPAGARLAALGIDAASLGDAVSARTQGTAAAQIAGESSTIPVNVRVAGSPASDAIGDTTLYTKFGPLPLATVARAGEPARASDINEENGRLVDRVSANIEGASLSAVIAGVQTALAREGLPPGYRASIGGTYQTQQASFREFTSVIAIAILLVFCVMLGTFGSFRLPLVILCAIPLALIGVAAMLFVTGTPINVSSFMGLLLLVGIVVKNGILLIDAANRRRAAGDDMMTALLRAGSTRVRPIVMTTLAAIGGLLPLALGFGSGTELERPLAIAVIGGLSTATAFTLVLIPVLYATMLRDPRGRTSRGAAVATVLALTVLVPQAAGAQTTAPQNTAGAAAEPSGLDFAQIDLAAAQQLAVVASPDVHLARALLDGATATLAQARSGTGFSLVGGYQETPQGAPGGTIAQRLTQYGGQVTLGDLAAFAPLVGQAAAAERAAESDEAAAERNERIKLVRLYYGALKARAARLARADAIGSAQLVLEAAQKRYAAGDAPRLDIVRAQVALARAQGDLATATADDGTATDALAREVDRPSSIFAATTPFTATVPAVPSPDVAVASAVAQRADLRSAESNIRASAAGVRAARRGILPAVTIGAGYARGIDSGFPANGPTLSATVSIPLGDGVTARVREQTALLNAARARRDGIARAVTLEAGSAARTAAASIEAERAALGALAAAGAELNAATLGYANGASSSLDISTSRASYVQAVVDALSAQYDRRTAQAVLALEIGA
jgi:outer membrane protein TolC/preprotein translocase subunit SecF